MKIRWPNNRGLSIIFRTSTISAASSLNFKQFVSLEGELCILKKRSYIFFSKFYISNNFCIWWVSLIFQKKVLYFLQLVLYFEQVLYSTNKSYIWKNKSYICNKSYVFKKEVLYFHETSHIFRRTSYIFLTSLIFWATSCISLKTSIFVRIGAP